MGNCIEKLEIATEEYDYSGFVDDFFGISDIKYFPFKKLNNGPLFYDGFYFVKYILIKFLIVNESMEDYEISDFFNRLITVLYYFKKYKSETIDMNTTDRYGYTILHYILLFQDNQLRNKLFTTIFMCKYVKPNKNFIKEKNTIFLIDIELEEKDFDRIFFNNNDVNPENFDILFEEKELTLEMAENYKGSKKGFCIQSVEYDFDIETYNVNTINNFV